MGGGPRFSKFLGQALGIIGNSWGNPGQALVIIGNSRRAERAEKFFWGFYNIAPKPRETGARSAPRKHFCRVCHHPTHGNTCQHVQTHPQTFSKHVHNHFQNILKHPPNICKTPQAQCPDNLKTPPKPFQSSELPQNIPDNNARGHFKTFPGTVSKHAQTAPKHSQQTTITQLLKPFQKDFETFP